MLYRPFNTIMVTASQLLHRPKLEKSYSPPIQARHRDCQRWVSVWDSDSNSGQGRPGWRLKKHHGVGVHDAGGVLILPTDFHLSYLIPSKIPIRMTFHDETISPPTTHLPASYLRPYVIIYAGPELRNIFSHTLKFMSHQLRQELLAEVPTDTNECTPAIQRWITRLNIIISGLASFPMLIDGGGISTTMEALTIAPPADGTTQAQQASLSQAVIIACLERDQYQCIITGRKFASRSGTEVVPIIPFAFASHPRCRDLDFWKMLEMFYGSEAAEKLFVELLESANSLENLITLDNSIHGMFNSGRLTLTPEKARRDPIPVINDYRGGYWLNIQYPHGRRLPGAIQSTKGFRAGEVRTLYRWSRIGIACHEGISSPASTLPLPSYFALRTFVLSLKNIRSCGETRAHKIRRPHSNLRQPQEVYLAKIKFRYG